jgi:hypothetical protein
MPGACRTARPGVERGAALLELKTAIGSATLRELSTESRSAGDGKVAVLLAI